jgi:uncharacterized protein YmfQ (DUF2313 family)
MSQVQREKNIISRLLPDGRAWEKIRHSFLVEGIAWEVKRLSDSVIELTNEIFPQTTTAMILDFEIMLGIDNSTLTLAERRVAIIDKLSKKGSFTLNDFYFAADQLNVTVNIVIQYPFRVGINRIGDRLYGLEWQYVIFIEAPLPQNQVLEDALNNMKPAWTSLVFIYS